MTRREVVEIDLRPVQAGADLQRILSDALDFPGWYGMNWDAFWDTITGLVEMPKTLRLVGWGEINERMPRDAGIMKQCLDDMADELPELASKVEYV